MEPKFKHGDKVIWTKSYNNRWKAIVTDAVISEGKWRGHYFIQRAGIAGLDMADEQDLIPYTDNVSSYPEHWDEETECPKAA